MGKRRRKHTDEFKAKVALETVKGVHTLGELSSKYGVHSTVIAQWKRKLINGAAGVFELRRKFMESTRHEASASLELRRTLRALFSGRSWHGSTSGRLFTGRSEPRISAHNPEDGPEG